jgi:hypothetical protein
VLPLAFFHARRLHKERGMIRYSVLAASDKGEGYNDFDICYCSRAKISWSVS